MKRYDELAEKYSISAREYFMVLRLAIYHIDGEYLETSYKIAQYKTSNEVYKCACELLTTLHNKRRDRRTK